MDIKDIPLYDPVVLSGVVEKMKANENLLLLNLINKTPYPFLNVVWDIIKGNRARGQANNIGAEAHVVPRLGRAQGSASGIAFREKKVFEPSTIEVIRAAGDLGRTDAEREIIREVANLNTRLDNFMEYVLWQVLTGTLVIDQQDVQANVDYKFLATHKPTMSTPWNVATPQSLVADITAMQKLIRRDGQVRATDVFATRETIDYIFDAFTNVTISSGSGVLGSNLLTDRMKDEYYNSGVISGFMNLRWTPVEEWYEDDAGTVTEFLPQNRLFMANLRDNTPWEMKMLPVYDFDAPRSHRGKFAKMFRQEDPSVESHLLACNFLPVVTRPEQIVYVADVTA